MRLLLICTALSTLAACATSPGVNEPPSREASLSAGAGGSHAPGSTGLGAGTLGPMSDPARVPADALAQNAGSQIFTTPQVPLSRPPVASEVTKRCDALRGDERERCLQDARNAAPSTTPPSGPTSTGMGSGAGTGTGANTGTSGGASFGSSGPR